MVGVVGTLNSSTSQTVQPILADRSIVQISPANTNPTLTLGEQPDDGAEAAVPELLPGRHDGPHPGPVRRPVPGAEGRQEEHRRDRRRQDLRRGPRRPVRPGGREARRRRSSRARRSARRTPTSPASSARSGRANPDAVYYGGEYPAAGPLSEQLAGAGLNVPLMGGDGIVDPTVRQARRQVRVTSRPTSARPAETLPSAKQFIADYKAAGSAEPFSAYGALTYDAANVIIDGAGQGRRQGGTWSDDDPQDAWSTTVQATNLTARAARSPSTSSATPPTRCSPSTRSRATTSRPIEGSTGSFQAS